MKINKSLDIDLNIISPQRNIQIHEGDIDSIDIVLAVSADDVSLDLTGLTIKYDATINKYLAEQDANGSVDDNKIVIPVTENMTAMPGLLLIDVRMIQEDEILFTRTIRATVERAVVNGSTYIDFSKITIVQRMNALEEQMTYIEELVDNMDTSKQIVSIRRPPQTAPATVDVDFFRVGDTWIYQGVNIVYKLVEADYNYQLGPEIPAVHKFTWQPLNEYFSYGTTEPPTSATYTEIGYVIGELTFNALPVPEYFIGDTYARVISGDVKTLFTLTDSAEVSSGQYTFAWHENGGGGDADNKMDLAPINPTAQEIEDMPSGQLYGDTANNKGIIKGGQSFYDSEYIDNRFSKIYASTHRPPWLMNNIDSVLKEGDIWIYKNPRSLEIKKICILSKIGTRGAYKEYIWQTLFTTDYYDYGELPPTEGTTSFEFYGVAGISTAAPLPRFFVNDEYRTSYNGVNAYVYICKSINVQLSNPITYTLYWGSPLPTTDLLSDDFSMSLEPTDYEHTIFPTVARMKELLTGNYYDSDQIDSKIGDIGTALDTLNDNLAEV